MARSANGEWRVEFDAEVTFRNGGRLQAEAFRLDIPGEEISDGDLAALFVRHLGLLMTDQVRIANKRLIREPHKGSRGSPGPTPEGRRLVPLSHVIRDGMVTYPGLPGPTITDHIAREASRASYSDGTEFQIGLITMVSNTGTYLDSPFHRFAGGVDLAAMELETVADLPGIVVRVAGEGIRAIDRNLLLAHEVRGRAVLLHTGWDRHWGTEEYGGDSPFLTREGASWLVERGAALVGIDSINIDDLRDRSRPAHTVLLGAGIPIVEHMCGLDQLPPHGFRFHAAPAPIQGMGTFPVRAYAVIDG
ncbi:MAG TPA: cyclase family protein [Candidatus Acidoferrum sp.]|nr:cyclase family protein [Candidatus Acidoferrum sp.]